MSRKSPRRSSRIGSRPSRPAKKIPRWLAKAMSSLRNRVRGILQWLRPQQSMGLGLLLMWVIGSLLVTRVLVHSFHGGEQTNDLSQFEAAFQWVSRLEVPDDASTESGRKFGISQMTYNRWRRSQNQPRQDVDNISEAEAKSLYQTYWQQEHCNSYAAPLDATCLDTIVNFGMSGFSSTAEKFFENLPSAPQAAAIEVANRRIDYRQRLLASADLYRNLPRNSLYSRPQYPRSPALRPQQPRSLPTVVVEGLRRDRDLLAQLEVYKPPQSSNFLWPSVPTAISTFIRQLSPLLNTPLSLASPQPQQALSSSQIFAKAEPFTVEVWITLEDGTYAPATGMILSADGLVLTNAHVVEGNPQPKIHTRDSQQNEHQYSGQVIAADRSVDLALIQISEASGLAIAPLADSTAQVKVGDTVHALGSPVGSHWKLTTAQVIEVQSQCGVPSLRCIRMPRNFLHPGNSGGPLLDTTGTVIGINRAVQGSTGEGVSIPVEDIKRFLQRQGK
jgi:hypothetical protein